MLVRALSAETLKLKRTLALWLAFIAPLLVIALQCMVVLRSEFALEAEVDPWRWFSQSTTVLWGLLMLPLFITLQTALLANLEHGEKTWKQLYAMPIPRWAIYAAKLIVNLGIIGLSTVMLWLGQMGAGWVLSIIKPSLHYSEWPIPWQFMLYRVTVMYLAVWLIIAIHTWVSLRWQSFALASSVGVGATIVSIIAVNSEWAAYFPWTQVVNIIGDHPNIPLAVGIGVIGCVAVGVVGGWDVVRRDAL